MPIDWQEFHRSDRMPPAVVDPRRRLLVCTAGFVLLLGVVLARAVQFELSEGPGFRAVALRPIRHEGPLRCPRGRILARDGTVLACDQAVAAVAVQYRYLEEPPSPAWLQQTARQRLPKAERRNAARLAEEMAHVTEQRAALNHRLAALCGVPPEQWQARAREIQARVERIAASVERRRAEASRAVPPEPASLWGQIAQALREVLQPARDPAGPVTIAEQLEAHVMAEGVSAAVVAEIEAHGELYPGTKVLHLTRRTYPCGALAAHVLGHLGPAEPPSDGVPAAPRDELVGRMGVERQYEPRLHGRSGVAVELTDHGGHVLSTFRSQEPIAGRDVTLTIDPRLQRAAEELLDSAIERRATQTDQPGPAGGAIVVMDVRSGELLAAASAPRFEPEVFVGHDSARRDGLLNDPGHPLFNRVIQMALPPGSVFKTLTAVALLEEGRVDPQQPFVCQGYLKQPDRQRCAIYVRQGIGHGEVTLADALAQSCNVYFFHHAGQLEPAALVDWAGRFGFGRPSGVDLPGEAAGRVPTPQTIQKLEGHRWHTSDTQTIAIGQGSLTATPLQVVRMMAAVANGGLLVTPRVVKEEPRTGQPIAGLDATALAAVREGLQRVVADPRGTAHGSVYLAEIAIAGKTGTASVGEGLAEHAWFAGYVPADRPRYAFVIVLEHAGDADVAAGPVAKRLVLRMEEAGLLSGAE